MSKKTRKLETLIEKTCKHFNLEFRDGLDCGRRKERHFAYFTTNANSHFLINTDMWKCSSICLSSGKNRFVAFERALREFIEKYTHFSSFSELEMYLTVAGV